MKRFLAIRVAVVVAVAISGGLRAWAVSGPNAVATNGFPWVVPLSFGPSGVEFLGTGSYITNGVVLTCAHNVGTGQFNSFAMGGQTYFALGVADPLYAGVNYDPNDIALWLVLNRPGAPGGAFPTVVAPGDPALTASSTVKVLGYGKSTNSLPIYGVMTMTNSAVTVQITTLAGSPHTNVEANTYSFVQPPSSELTDKGDSGGPYIANIGGVDKIVAVHTSGYTATNDNVTKLGALGVRVDSHMDFVTGNGQDIGGGNYQSTLVRLGGTGNTIWDTAASWQRASTNFAAAPKDNDVAVLDPTAASDAATTVRLTNDTANLNGLLNDTTLNLNGHTLNVNGTSGVLNGGVINATGNMSVASISYGYDNEGGTLNIAKGGVANVGGALNNNQTGMFNGSNGTIAVQGGGFLNVDNGAGRLVFDNANRTSVVTVQGDATDGGTINTGFLDSYGTLTVGSRGYLFLSLSLWNEKSGTFTMTGGGNGDGTGNVFRLVNAGTVTVGNGGVLQAGSSVTNFGPISVNGGSVLTPRFVLGFATNFPSDIQATSLVTTTGTVTMTSGNIGVTNALTQGLLDVQTGTFTMNGGNLSVDQWFVTNAASSRFYLNGGVVTSSFTQVANGLPFTVGSNAVPAVLALAGTGFGANHTFSNGLNIAVTPDAAGSVYFSGNMLTATNGTTMVGLRGTGLLVVSNAGSFYGNNLVVASTNGSVGTFQTTGGGSSSEIRGFFTVGDMQGSSGTVSLVSATLLATNASTLIGNGGVGQFTATNGVVTLRDVTVGVTNGAKGAVALYNNNTTFTQPLSVGSLAGSQGSLLVSGGQLSVLATTTVFGAFIGDAGNGSLVVSNATASFGSTVTVVGNTNGGQGFLSIAGGTVTVNSFAAGEEDGATGVVFIASGELNATNGTTGFGVRGTGSLMVTGGIARMSSVLVGNSAPGDGTISMSGGSITLANYLALGDGPSTKGALWIAGGTFAAGDAQIDVGVAGLGRMAVSNGMASVGTLTVARDFLSDGQLTMAGGTLTVANWLHVADQITATGSVLVTGGSLSITNGPTIVGNAGSGRLTISNVTVQARDVTIAAQLGSHGTLTLNNGTLATVSLVNNTNGFVLGVGTIDGPVTNAGTISPGFSPGKIFITGKLTLQPTSTVVMELGGTGDADYDHIIIGDALQADGTLDVSLINAFNPASGDTFDIFDFTSSGGQFSITNLPALNPGLSWDTSNLMTLGEIAVVPEPSTLLLVIAGFGSVLLIRRRSTRATGHST